jgi:hypothetical protein
VNNIKPKYKASDRTPDWLCYPANFENLVTIQKQVYRLVLKTRPTREQNFSLGIPYWAEGSKQDKSDQRQLVRDYCPALMDELKRLQLYDRFLGVSFIVTSAVPNSMKYTIHVDSVGRHVIGEVQTHLGLNFPVLNCNKSFTVWYNVENGLFSPLSNDQGLAVEIPPEIEQKIPFEAPKFDDAVEIGRCDSTIPHWINTGIPHQPVVNHSYLRINASVRFTEDPVDENLNLWPHLIKQ